MMKQPDELDVGNKWDLVVHRLMIAEEDLNSAQVLMDCTQYRGANNRAYYSIYHTIDAILSINGIAFKRHKDTLAYFNKNYIATEIFPRTLGRQIVQAEEIRHASDYDPFYIASKEGTQKQINTAKTLLTYAKEYISQQKNSDR